MTENIYNTLFILAKVTKCKAAILLKLNNLQDSVVSFYGDNPARFDEFKRSVHHLYLSSGVDKSSVMSLPAFKSVSTALGVSSCYIENVFSVNEMNESFYLILFTDEVENYDQENHDILLSIINVLSNQVKELIAEELNQESENKLPVPGSSIDEKIILKNWKENFRNLFELSQEIIFLLDSNGCFLQINNNTSLLLDYKIEEIKGKHFLDLVADKNKTEVSIAFNRLIHSNKHVKFSANLKTKLDREIAFDFNCKTIVKDGKIIGVIGTGMDISNLKSYEDELKRLKPKLIEAQRLIEIERARVQHQRSIIEELNRLKSEFVSNISHEFRTPLASIIGFSETIVSDPDLPEEMKSEFNSVILNEGKRLAKLINDVLDLSKIEGHKISILKSTFDVVEMLEKVVEENEPIAKDKNVTLVYEHPDEQIFLDGDREKLAQAIDALINNAIKFTNDYGRVKIIVNNLFKEVELIVTDTGIGIPEKDLPYIFQKFYRVSRPGTEIPGTGIGLVFVKQIVDLHKGLISVQSEIGNGTTFIVKLLKSIRGKKERLELE